MLKIERVKIAGQLERVNYLLLLSAIMVIPLAVDGGISNAFLFPKWILGLAFASLFVISALARWVLLKQITIHRAFIDKAIVILFGALVVSGIFGTMPINSLVGNTDYFVYTIGAAIVFAVFYFDTVHELNSNTRFYQLLDTLVVAGLISNLLFLARAIFNLSIVGGHKEIWNTIDGSSANFGLWITLIFLVSVGLLIKKDVFFNGVVLYVSSALFSLLSLVILHDRQVLEFLLFGIAILLLIGGTFFKAANSKIFIALSIVFVLVVLLLSQNRSVFPFSIADETRLNYMPSAVIVFQTLGSGIKEALFGTGSGTFSIDFSKFRDIVFNYSSATALRFNYPYSSAFTLFTELGLVGVIVFGSLIFTVVRRYLKNWKKLLAHSPVDDSLLGDKKIEKVIEKEMRGMDVIFIFVAWMVLTVGFFFVQYTFLLWLIWWVLLGVMVSGFNILHPYETKIKNISLEGSFKKRFAFSTTCIFLSLVIVFIFLLNTRWYGADRLFGAALASNDFASKESGIKSAIKYHDLEKYHLTLSKTYIEEAEVRSKDVKPDLRAISTLLGNSINEAKRATEIAPRSVVAWEGLGTAYEKSSGLAPEASLWAASTLEKALELEPTNALDAARIGSNYELSENWGEAVRYYQKAVALKSDFTEVYLALANAYERNKENNKAIDIFSTIFQKSPNNLDAVFNYGRLLYNRNSPGDREAAERLWLKVLEKQPDNSNALYSLGLLNEVKGNRKVALSFYYKVRELNPGNTAINTKIKRLGGK